MTKGSTSVAKKVLCSALSAAIVVAFAPAIGAAAGSSDGVAYAAENGQGEEKTFEIETSLVYSDEEEIVQDPSKLAVKVKGEGSDGWQNPLDSSSYEIEKQWYVIGTPSNPYVAIEPSGLQCGTWYYLHVVGKGTHAGYSGYAGVSYLDAKSLSNYRFFSVGNAVFRRGEHVFDHLDDLKLNIYRKGTNVGAVPSLGADIEFEKCLYTLNGDGKSYTAVEENGQPYDTPENGAYYVRIIPKEGAGSAYAGEAYLRIDVANISFSPSVSFKSTNRTWAKNGSAPIPDFEVSYNGTLLTRGVDYVVDDHWYKRDDSSSSWEPVDKLEFADEESNTFYIKLSATESSGFAGDKYVDVSVFNEKRLSYSYMVQGDSKLKMSDYLSGKATLDTIVSSCKLYCNENGMYFPTEHLESDGKWYGRCITNDGNGEKADYIELESPDKILSSGKYDELCIKINAIGEGYSGSIWLCIDFEDDRSATPCQGGHKSLVKHEAVASTCQAKGAKEYWECAKCGLLFSDATGEHEIKEVPELPLAAHKYDSGTITTAPTCTTSGVKTSHCTVCAATKTEPVAAKGHRFQSGSINWTSGGVSAATATFTCDNGCGKSETVTASISKKLTTKPTCTVKGVNTYTATATSSTGATTSSSKTVQDEPALGHAYGPYTVTVQPTADKTGTATAKCTHEGCTSTVTRTLEKLKSEQTVSGAAGTGTTATATVTEIKPATTPSGINVAGSVSLDSVTAPANATKIEVPETVTINNVEYAVTKVDPKVFADKAALTEVSLPDTVEELPAGLFKDCSSLATVKLPSKITEIPADTFNGTAIANAVLPATVTKIGNRAFKGTELASVDLPSNLSSLGKDAFKDCKKLTGVTLPSGLKTLPSGAFSGCAALKGIAPAAGIKALDLAGAAAPTTVDISKVTTIGANAFKGCKSITAVNAPKAATIGAGAFSGTAKLRSLKTGTGLKSIGKSALSGNKKLKTLELKTKKLTKSGVKSSLKGSAIKTVSVKVAGSKKTKAKYITAYKKIFTAKNCGKKVNVK